MTANELRVKFIEFFKKNGHTEIKSASLKSTSINNFYSASTAFSLIVLTCLPS